MSTDSKFSVAKPLPTHVRLWVYTIFPQLMKQYNVDPQLSLEICLDELFKKELINNDTLNMDMFSVLTDWRDQARNGSDLYDVFNKWVPTNERMLFYKVQQQQLLTVFENAQSHVQSEIQDKLEKSKQLLSVLSEECLTVAKKVSDASIASASSSNASVKELNAKETDNNVEKDTTFETKKAVSAHSEFGFLSPPLTKTEWRVALFVVWPVTLLVAGLVGLYVGMVVY